MCQTVFLLGFMGSGKSTLGKKLANRLKLPFLDTDKEIENKYGLTVSQFFEKYGEDKFRLEEKAIIRELDTSQPRVVAVGGGLPCFHKNITFMNEKGITIYLKRPAKELFQRLKQGKSKRPLITDLSDPELLSYIEEKLQERSVYYEQAQVIAGRDEQTVELLAGKVRSID